MSKGHVFLAQNSDVDYVTQAYALALSIKHNNAINNQTCLITNNTVPQEYRHAFDHIVDIPWKDNARDSTWKIENRWKIINASPFKESLSYDTDMLLLSSNDHWWDFLKNADVSLTTNVTDYKGRNIQNDFYRKAFTANDLPNVYMGVHYFKKNKRAFEFYKWLEVITKHYEEFYSEFLPKHKQRFCSMDVNAALAVKFMQAESEFLNPLMTFTHMKPAVQGWSATPNSWKNTVGSYFNRDKTLIVGNFLQLGVFHYTEDAFLTKEIIEILENSNG
jgi:hypothetical protein